MFDDIVNDDGKGADPAGFPQVDYEKEYGKILQQIEKLADYIMAEFQDKIGQAGSLGAVDEAIRLLEEYKNMLEAYNGGKKNP